MEIAIAVFIGAWIVVAAICAFAQLKKDYEQSEDKEGRQ